MNSTEKKALTLINKIPLFNRCIKLLTTNRNLTDNEKTYLLTCAILFLKHYEADKRVTSYAEFAYYIILKYSVNYSDYVPLYDFSASFGFYPIVRSILENKLMDRYSLDDCFLNIEVERFQNETYIETFHQYREKNNILVDFSNELSFVAPTSFGKSSIIVDCIKKYEQADVKRIGVIGPFYTPNT